MPVIVTRPQPEAGQWGARLRHAGIEAVALPLIEIAPVADTSGLRDAWRVLDDFHAVMFVSANAARSFFDEARGTAFTPRAWVTGPGTAAALCERGIESSQIDSPPDDAGQFDSESLWRRVAPEVRAGTRILIVRGGDAQGEPAGRDWLADAIHAAGGEVSTVVAYRRAAPRWSDAEQARGALAAHDGSWWLLSSSEAIGNLRALLPRQDWSVARAIATHPRIAATARAAGFGSVLECRPAFDDVLACLQSAG